MEQLHAFVSGEVQGVGFRFFVDSKARALGLTGFVKNLSNRKVEVLAQGKRESLMLLLNFLRKGPSRGRVDNVEVQWEKPDRTFSGFEIKHY